MADREYGFRTRAIHAGNIPDATTGARALPIYQSSAFVFDDADDAAARTGPIPPAPGGEVARIGPDTPSATAPRRFRGDGRAPGSGCACAARRLTRPVPLGAGVRSTA